MGCEVFWISVTAIASWALVAITWVLVRSQIKLSKEDLRVRLQTNYEEKFDSATLIAERKKLAEQLLTTTPHEDIQEPVINFFESVGMLVRRGYLDPDMVWSGFSFFALRWWSACKDYILEERRIENNDKTIFEEFEKLIDELYKIEIEKRHLSRAELEPSKQDMLRFLKAESNL
jgi:hypothetical protein